MCEGAAREAQRPRSREAEGQSERGIERRMNREADGQSERGIERQRSREAEGQRNRYRATERDKHRDTLLLTVDFFRCTTAETVKRAISSTRTWQQRATWSTK